MESTKVFLYLSLCLALILGLVESFDYQEKELETEEGLQGMYDRWREHHNVKEKSPERFNVFKYNVQNIHRTNKMNKPYKLGVNKFAATTQYEFENTYASLKSEHVLATQGYTSFPLKEDWFLANITIPPKIDWRCKNAVTPVKSQGECRGGSWAFGAVFGLEGVNAIETNKLVGFSEQELIDCDTKDSKGCEVGLPGNAYKYIAEQGGLATEESYPYVGKQGPCDTSKIKRHSVKVSGYVNVPRDDETALHQCVANQPTIILLNACAIIHYKEGVFTGSCGNVPNHIMGIVGFDQTPEGLKYWIVKNSWGEDWGEKGYLRIQRETGNPEGLCGMNKYPMLPAK